MAKPQASARTGSSFSILGADTALTGNIDAGADLHVEGRIDGDVSCLGLVQGEKSVITGAIRAESIRLSGTLNGTVDARNVVLLATARIDGDIAYDTLTMEQGAQVSGRLSPRGTMKAPAVLLTASIDEDLILSTPN